MEKINNRKAARNIKVCDFSTLYTKIPLTDLKEKLKEVVTKAFKGGTNQFIRVNKKDAHWDNSRDGQTFSKEQIFLLIDLVIDNSFFRFGNKVFWQKIGIPMGVDPANVENQDDNHATFLDIEVNVEGDQFKTKAYDKRENYKFEIVNYPDLSGNIPHGAAYGVYTSQVIRYARVCKDANDFKESRESKSTYQQTHYKGIHHQSPEKHYEEMPWEA